MTTTAGWLVKDIDTGASGNRLHYYVVVSEPGVDRRPVDPHREVPWRSPVAAPPRVGDMAAVVDAASRAASGIVVEEFVFTPDYHAIGINCAGWSGPSDGWWSSAQFSRRMRTDPQLRSRVIPVSRRDAEITYRRMGGGELPAEAILRTYLQDCQSLEGSAPLRLSLPQAPDGFTEVRRYRILFANDMSAEVLGQLVRRWSMSLPDTPDSRVVGTAERGVGADRFVWELRRIGAGVAWCVDVIAYLGGESDNRVGVLLWKLTETVRGAGLIPVTIERVA